MATRMIVTSQPDVPCDVCGRRLLRGEQPDVFLAGGNRRTVCELCAPRATHEGWLRESEQARSLQLSPARPRRGHGLLGRLRALREPASIQEAAAAAQSESSPAQAQSSPSDSSPHAMVEVQTAAEAQPIVETQPAVESVELLNDDKWSRSPSALAHDELDGGEDGVFAPLLEAQEDMTEARRSPEEGSWRDAWMFVGE
jgi:hypothetical protein